MDTNIEYIEYRMWPMMISNGSIIGVFANTDGLYKRPGRHKSITNGMTECLTDLVCSQPTDVQRITECQHWLKVKMIDPFVGDLPAVLANITVQTDVVATAPLRKCRESVELSTQIRRTFTRRVQIMLWLFYISSRRCIFTGSDRKKAFSWYIHCNFLLINGLNYLIII